MEATVYEGREQPRSLLVFLAGHIAEPPRIFATQTPLDFFLCSFFPTPEIGHHLPTPQFEPSNNHICASVHHPSYLLAGNHYHRSFVSEGDYVQQDGRIGKSPPHPRSPLPCPQLNPHSNLLSHPAVSAHPKRSHRVHPKERLLHQAGQFGTGVHPVAYGRTAVGVSAALQVVCRVSARYGKSSACLLCNRVRS